MNKATLVDAFDMLCGKELGRGISRIVFECRLRDDLVVKVEDAHSRYFANVIESKFWSDNQFASAIASWLAPIKFMSPDGRILLQRRCQPLPKNFALPAKLPIFLTDLKRENFGLLDGRLVCMDYALTIASPSVRMVKTDWGDNSSA